MEPDKNTAHEPTDPSLPDNTGQVKQDAQAPADALSRTPDDLATDPNAQAAAAALKPLVDPNAKKLSRVKMLFRKLNLYLLIFILLLVIAGAIAIVNFLNSQKQPPVASVPTQNLSSDALKQLANTDASVGNSSQTLNIQGNAVIAGQTLARGNLSVAGNFQAGGSIQGANLTIGGTSNLNTAQINTLQVAQTVAIQGTTTLRDLNVSGATTMSGPLTASSITTSSLTLSGNAKLTIPNHISFSGPSPNRTISGTVLGNGGSASINGSDTSGTININSGNNPTAGCFLKLNFQQAYSNPPHVLISPVGSAAAQLQYYATRDQSGFSICTNIAAAPNQVFAFDYFVTN